MQESSGDTFQSVKETLDNEQMCIRDRLATDEAFETFNAETYTGMAYVTGAINEENIRCV